MGGVDEAAGDVELDGKGSSPFEVAAPPAAVGVKALDALDEDEPGGIDGEDGVAGALGSEAPVEGGIAAAPAGGGVGFIVEVSAEDHGVADVALGEHQPVGNPAGLGIGRGIPEGGLGGSVRAMAVEDDAQADLGGVADNLVHDVQAGKALQIGVEGEVDASGDTAGVEELGGKGEAQGVVAEAEDLAEHILVVALVQAVRSEGGGFEAEPVDAGNADGAIGGIEELGALGMPGTGADGGGGGRKGGRKGGRGDRGGGEESGAGRGRAALDEGEGGQGEEEDKEGEQGEEKEAVVRVLGTGGAMGERGHVRSFLVQETLLVRPPHPSTTTIVRILGGESSGRRGKAAVGAQARQARLGEGLS